MTDEITQRFAASQIPVPEEKEYRIPDSPVELIVDWVFMVCVAALGLSFIFLLGLGAYCLVQIAP